MAMAYHSGIGISKVLFIAVTGYTGTVLIKNGKLSDLIGDLQALVKGLEKSGDQAEGEGEHAADAIAAQIRRLANEVKHLTSNRQTIVMNGGSGQSSNLSSLVVPAATLGAVGYGYMWLKGVSFSDLMYVTKRNMENAVADLTKKLQHASDVIADAKKHLTQRIQILDDKMRKQYKMAQSIKDDVNKVQDTVTTIHDDLSVVQHTVKMLDGRLNSVLENQEFANMGLDYIIGFITANARRVPDSLQGTIPKEQPKLPGRSTSMLTYPGFQGLKDIAESLSSLDRSASDTIVPGGLDNLEKQRRPLLRATSTKC